MHKMKHRSDLVANTSTHKYMLLMVWFIPLVFSCQEDNSFNKEAEQLNFEILTLDENHNEKGAFASGTDVVFVLKLTNNSDKAFEWEYDYTCQLFQADEFLVVYKKNQDGESAGTHFPIGTPYQWPVNCQAINLPSQKILSGDKVVLIKLPWSSNPDNQNLSPGDYYIQANIGININGHDKNWDLVTDFVVD